MALREIIMEENPLLRQKSRIVTIFDDKLWVLLDDMLQTMRRADGVGLAAVQVGVLRRVVVIDAGEEMVELINPTLLYSSGSQTSSEGCLSVDSSKNKKITRPNVVTFEALDRYGKKYQKTVTGLFARAVCHELEHLDGKLFIDIV